MFNLVSSWRGCGGVQSRIACPEPPGSDSGRKASRVYGAGRAAGFAASLGCFGGLRGRGGFRFSLQLQSLGTNFFLISNTRLE